MSKILLVSPSQAASYGKMTPPSQIHMGLAYLASMVSSESVDIIDADSERMSQDAFADILRRKNYDIAGFTVTTPTLSSSLALAKEVKNESPGTLVVFGGIHPTIRPHETIANDCVDAVVRGEGELTFKEIVESLKNGRGLSGIKGLIYKKGGKTEEEGPRPLISDLDSIPFPARHLFKNKEYTYPDALYRNTAPIITSRGCPGFCTYCNANQIFTRAFRARSARNVADEIEFLTKEMKIREIHIWDDNFTMIKKRVFEIRDEILKRGVRAKFAFPNGVRADFLDREMLGALKEMGTYSLALCVESGSQEVLNKARKGIRLEKVEEVFALAKEMRLETWAFFMIGLPGEDASTIRKTIDFAKRMDPDIAKFHILKPYPGTEVYDYLKEKKFVLTEDYDQFGIHTPPIHRLETLSSSDMLEWQKKAYASFYFRPGKIAKQVLRIKTFNRFILNLQAGFGLTKMVLSKN
ncbi:MAG: radical SAM protein [Candidatus Omnitrophica bacterium]|nr:radical SAM protein [Candidatus Omnitrophota bacterium]